MKNTTVSFIDARQFFSHSPYRSTYFLIASFVFLVDIGYGSYLVFENWNKLSSFRLSQFLLAAGLLVNTYRSTLNRFRSVRNECFNENSSAKITNETLQGVALSTAVGTIEVITFCYCVIALLLTYIGSLLKHI